MAGSRIKGITIEIDGNTQPLQKALQATNKDLKSTQAALKDVNKLLKMDPGNVTLLKQKHDLLKKSIEDTKTKLDTEKQALQQLKSADQTPEVVEQQNKLEREIAETEQQLESLKKEMSSFGSVAKQQLQAAGEKIKNVGEGLTKNVTAPLTALGGASIAAFKTVDDGYDEMIKKTGATGEAADELRGIMNNLASDIPTSFETAGAAVGEVSTRFGVTGDELESLSAQFIKFADLNNTDVSSSVDKVQKAMSAYGLGVEDAEGFLDRLNATGQETGVSVDKLAEGIVTNGAAFQELGLNIDQATSFMGQLEKSGANSETVLNGMRKALKNAAAEGKPLDKALAELQSTIKDGNGSMDGLTAAYDLFGKSGDQIYAAVKNGTLDFENLATTVSDASGSINATFEETVDPLDQFEMSMNKLKITGAEIGASLLTILAPAIEKLGGVVETIKEKWDGLSPGAQDAILKVGLIAAALGPVLVILGTLATAIGALLSPVGLVVAAIAGVVAVLGVLWAKNEKFREFVTGLWEGLKSVATTIWNTITGLFSGEITLSEVATSAWEALKSAASTIWEAIKGWFTEKIDLKEIATTAWETAKSTASTIWEAIKGFFTETINLKEIATGVFDTAKGAAETAWNAVKDAWEGAPPVVKKIAETAWETAKSAAETAWTTLKSKWEEAAPVVQSIATTAWDTAKEAATTAWDNIKSAWEGAAPVIADISTSAFDAVKTAASDIWESIKEIFMSFDITWPDFGALASGALEGLKNAAKGAWDWIKGLFAGDEGEIDTSSVSGATAEMEKAFSEVNLEISKVDVSSLDEANKYASDSIKSIERSFKGMRLKINKVDTLALTSARNATTLAVNAIKTAFTSMLLVIPAVNTAALTTLRTVTTTTVSAVRTAINTVSLRLPAVNTAVLTTMRSTATSAANAVSSTIGGVSLRLPAVNTGALNNAKSAASGAASAISGTINGMSLSIPSVGTSALSAARSAASSAISGIKSLMNFSWSLPKPDVPAMPHVSPSFSLRTSPDGKTKAYSVDWQTRWYAQGGIFTEPTLFQTPYGMAGVGEAGAEAVLPLSLLWKNMEKMGADIVSGVSASNQIYANMLARAMSDVSIQISDREFGRLLRGYGAI